jgi:hypothetical protein
MSKGEGCHGFYIEVPLQGDGSEGRCINRIDHARVQCRGDIGDGQGNGIRPHGGKRFFRNGIAGPGPHLESRQITHFADRVLGKEVNIAHFRPGDELEASLFEVLGKEAFHLFLDKVHFIVVPEKERQVKNPDHGKDLAEADA